MLRVSAEPALPFAVSAQSSYGFLGRKGVHSVCCISFPFLPCKGIGSLKFELQQSGNFQEIGEKRKKKMLLSTE